MLHYGIFHLIKIPSHFLHVQILIQGRESLNRAVDGDIVAIELLPEEEWTAPSEIVLEDKSDDAVDDDTVNNEKETERILHENASNKEQRTMTGRIVGIIKRKWRQYCGILQRNILEGSSRHIFCPAERKIPRVRIETRQAEKLYGQRIIVAIDQWPRHSRYPQGHFVRALGPLGDRETENEVLLIEHDVPHSKFSEEVLSCLPELPWIITEQVREIRTFIFNPNLNFLSRLKFDLMSRVRESRHCVEISSKCVLFFAFLLLVGFAFPRAREFDVRWIFL